MQVVPSTLHRQFKFIYNNKMYTLFVDTNLQACLQTSSSKSSSSTSDSSSNIPTSLSTPSDSNSTQTYSLSSLKETYPPKDVLLDDD